MSEEKKEECCTGTKNSCCCSGAKKLLVGIILAGLIFTCGYIFGKGHCPFSSCQQKMCPIMQH